MTSYGSRLSPRFPDIVPVPNEDTDRPILKKQAECFPLLLRSVSSHQEREKEGILEKITSLESATQDNVKLAQKVAHLEGQVKSKIHWVSCETLRIQGGVQGSRNGVFTALWSEKQVKVRA